MCFSSLGLSSSSGFTQAIQRRLNANVHFSNGSAVPAIEPFLRPVIFYLNGFNSERTSGCQRTEMALARSFSAHQSFIITRIHQPILVITDYRQDQGDTHTHSRPSDCMSSQESKTHFHIRRSETGSLPPPLFTEVLLNTLWIYKKFK